LEYDIKYEAVFLDKFIYFETKLYAAGLEPKTTILGLIGIL
jgi:hypothetical protein